MNEKDDRTMNVDDMVMCDGCHRLVLNTTKIKGMTFCQRCITQLKHNRWKKFIFSSVDELKMMRDDVEKVSQELRFPKQVTMNLVRLFDDYIDQGFIQSVYGASQQMFIYKDHFEIKTDDFFRKTLMDTVSGMLQKDSKIDGFNSNMLSKMIPQGTIRYKYKDFKSVKLSTGRNRPLDCIIVFKNKNDPYSLDDVYFFFAHYALPEVKERINNAVKVIQEHIQMSNQI